ncbi:hypothetical protein [Halomicrococcus sp. SG-WS-1]|uniref:hypothetical protein n=1 Tax=Halomicrococcus sp. SG-WS-1 TaxID=3439057 RepID=UPI003F78D2F1
MGQNSLPLRPPYRRLVEMADSSSATDQTDIEERIERIGRYSQLVKAGLGVIIGAFILSVVAVLPANLNSVAAAVNAVLLPLIFVGMGLLLFGIGMHLHLLHLNLVRQIRKQGGQTGQSAKQDAETES